MARFRFDQMRSCDAPVLNVDAGDLHELHQQLSRNLFVAGHMTTPDADGILPGVLIAPSRIQLVAEIA